MKSKHLLLTLLMALLVPWAASAQETVTVNDGTTTNGNVPVYGYYADAYNKCEFVQPAADLADMNGATIDGVTFYASQSSVSWVGANFQVFLTEVASTSISGFTGPGTVVYEGALSISGGEMTVTFTTPYTYNGGNLLVGVYQTATGGYSASTWYGVNTTGASGSGYSYSSLSGCSFNQRNFLPKTTFNYVPAASDCERPDDLLALDEPTAHEFSFNIEGGSGVYNIELKAGSDDWETYALGIEATTINLTNLESNTAYQVRVQSVCDDNTSGWKTLSFTTKNPCAAPTNLQVSDITASSATLSWTPGYQETEWTVKYKKSTETEYTSTTVSRQPSINLTGLDGCTQYNVQIYNCESYLSGNFVTAAGIPFTESFATISAPAGWTRYSGLLSAVMSGTALTTITYGWNFNPGNGVFDNHAWVNIYGSSCQYWLVAPTLTMENNVQLTFDLALTKYSGTLQPVDPTQQTDDKFVVLITTNGGATWEILRQWDNESSNYVYNEIACSAVGETVAIDLSSYAGQDIAVAFYGESTADGGDNNLHIDNVSIDYIPDCAKPTGLAKANVTAHTVDLSWTSDAEAWEIQLNEEDPISVRATSYTFSGLVPETTYSVKVRTNCDGDYSDWTTAVNFTTGIACPAPTVAVSNITAYTAEVNCTNTDAEYFNVMLGENVVAENVTMPYTLTDLTDNTSYTVKVKAICGGEDGESQWSNGTSFMTAEICPEGMVCIGTGTATSNYMPLNNYYKYSLTEQIYTADEIGEAGAILSIDFYKAATVEAVKVLDIYIVSTTKDEFTSTSDWIPVTASDLVYSGTVTFADNAWTTIELDSPFIYDGVSNICIVVDNNTGSYKSNTAFRVFSAEKNQALYQYHDNTNLDPTAASIGTGNDKTATKNRVRFAIGEPPACPKPTGVTASDVTAHEATITWTSDASAWEIQLNEEEVITVTEPTYTFTGLVPETTYSVKVRTNCDGDYSDWTTAVNFTTGIACPVPTVAVSNITAYTAEVNCTNTDAEYFNVKLGENVVAENVTMPYTLTDLTDNTSYTVKVKAICGGEDGESQWSNGTSFMTAEICPEGMVCIGTGTNANQSVPTYPYYNYSLTQQIYTAAEIGQSGEITSVDFYKSGTNGGARTLDIYMVSTDKETFSGATDWIAVTASDLVYSGSVTFQNDAWTTIEFNTPFLYDGTTNIALIVDDNTGSYVFSAPNFYAFNATSQAIRIYSDDTNYDATAPSSYSGTVLPQKNRIRIAIGEPPACPKPTGLAVNYTGGITATVTWEGDATSYNIDVNGTVTEGVTSPYTLEGLELATTYAVMVQANCGEDLSEWTSAVSFTTDLCMPENQCEITFELTDSFGDGWNGAYIEVVDVTTETVLGQFTNTSEAEGGEAQIYTLAVCNGRAIQFVWHSGSYDYEASYVVTDLNGEEIFSGSGVMSAPINYTVNCTVITCKKPKDLAAFDINKTSVVLSWTPGSEDQNAWRICYNDGEEDHFKNVTTIPYTLNGLTPETEYTVKVRANCGGGDYSNWSDEISFTTAEACPAYIYDFSAYNITVHNALLSWTGEFNSYQVRYKKWTGETEWSDAIPTNEAAIALSGLEAGTEYEYQVQGYCSDVDAYSEWVDGDSFETQSICDAPQNLYAVPGINSATISWTGYQESYTVACGDTVETVYGTTYTLEGLKSSTEYTVTVTGVGTECGEYQSATLEFATGAGWDDPSAWAEPGVLNDSTVVVIEPGDGPTEIPENISVGDGSYIVIEPGAEVIYGGGDPIPVVLGSDDDDDDDDGMGPRCRDNELPGGYRLIAPPVFNSLLEQYVTVVSTHLMDLPDDYFVNDLYSFDVNYPAQEWRNYKELANNFVNFNWKQGYLFYGYYTKVNWQGHIVANTNNSVKIALDYNEAHTYFHGANLIGNPFWAKGYPDMNFYVLNTAGNEVIPATNNYVGKAKGFFVLAEGPYDTCTVYTEAPDALRSLNIALSQDCSLIDAAAIRFNDTKGLAKIQLNPNHTKIYMPFEGKDYAILQGEGLGEMPLNFEAEENGTYTLSFTSKEVNFSYLHLIDNLTGVETNLLANPSYSFEAKTTDYASRFRLVYATGSSVNGDNFGFINSMGNLSIYGIEGEATLQVMDVLGHILSSETFSGSYERKLNVAPGVYMLRLINGNDVKVQKMVIR